MTAAAVRAIVRDELRLAKIKPGRRPRRCGTTGETMPPKGNNYPRCMGSAIYGSHACTCVLGDNTP